jgi:ABC-type branched-chain amino acid transport systems, ATPase component
MSQLFLELHGLIKDFGGLRAVDNVSFSMNRNEMLGLIGPNGAGKTTLVRLITGVLRPDSGSIRFKGNNIVGFKTWEIINLGIACTFQNMRPFRRLPIIANVMVSCLCPRAMKRGEWVKRVEAKAMDALEFAGISDMSLEKASTLSQGDLKRLEVARAIATEPELLLLDEPFGGLSPAETDLMAKSIKRLHKRIAGPSTLEVSMSFTVVIWAVFGGIVTIYGPVGAVFILFPVLEFLRFWPEFRMLMFAVVILFILLYMPDGLLPWLRDKIEEECPRCKIRNVATRKTCRVCTAPLD